MGGCVWRRRGEEIREQSWDPKWGKDPEKKGLGLEANLGPQHHFAFAVQSPVLLDIKSLFGKSGSANI